MESRVKSRVKSRVLVRERRLGCRLGDTVELAATQYERTLEESPPWDAPPWDRPPWEPPTMEPPWDRLLEVLRTSAGAS